MKVEIGKRYVTASGDIVKIDQYSNELSEFEYWSSSLGLSFSKNGKYLAVQDSVNDLILEVNNEDFLSFLKEQTNKQRIGK
jgi:hypothetical protein